MNIYVCQSDYWFADSSPSKFSATIVADCPVPVVPYDCPGRVKEYYYMKNVVYFGIDFRYVKKILTLIL